MNRLILMYVIAPLINASLFNISIIWVFISSLIREYPQYVRIFILSPSMQQS